MSCFTPFCWACVGRSIYIPHTLHHFTDLGLDPLRSKKLAYTLHKHSVQYAYSVVTYKSCPTWLIFFSCIYFGKVSARNRRTARGKAEWTKREVSRSTQHHKACFQQGNQSSGRGFCVSNRGARTEFRKLKNGFWVLTFCRPPMDLYLPCRTARTPLVS